MNSARQRLVRNLVLSVVCAIAFITVCRSTISWPSLGGSPQPKWSLSGEVSKPQIDKVNEPERIALVVASQTTDNTSWLEDSFAKWEKAIYLTDAPSNLSVPANKGREGMVYLTYIIDNYDKLPSLTIFQHANRYQWHNDDPLYDGERMLSRLQIPFVKSQGYVNLRCVWTLGCPDEIKPLEEFVDTSSSEAETSGELRAGAFYKPAFEELFPGVPVPETVGASCCAQFAVTADKIRERPLSDYENYRRWLLETPLSDHVSGRIMEYLWHIIFGKDAVDCPNAQQCYCDVYGLCGLECETDGVCAGQYTLPRFSVMPDGWPDYGWDGKWQNVSQLRIEQDHT